MAVPACHDPVGRGLVPRRGRMAAGRKTPPYGTMPTGHRYHTVTTPVTVRVSPSVLAPPWRGNSGGAARPGPRSGRTKRARRRPVEYDFARCVTTTGRHAATQAVAASGPVGRGLVSDSEHRVVGWLLDFQRMRAPSFGHHGLTVDDVNVTSMAAGGGESHKWGASDRERCRPLVPTAGGCSVPARYAPCMTRWYTNRTGLSLAEQEDKP